MFYPQTELNQILESKLSVLPKNSIEIAEINYRLSILYLISKDKGFMYKLLVLMQYLILIQDATLIILQTLYNFNISLIAVQMFKILIFTLFFE